MVKASSARIDDLPDEITGDCSELRDPPGLADAGPHLSMSGQDVGVQPLSDGRLMIDASKDPEVARGMWKERRWIVPKYVAVYASMTLIVSVTACQGLTDRRYELLRPQPALASEYDVCQIAVTPSLQKTWMGHQPTFQRMGHPGAFTRAITPAMRYIARASSANSCQSGQIGTP